MMVGAYHTPMTAMFFNSTIIHAWFPLLIFDLSKTFRLRQEYRLEERGRRDIYEGSTDQAAAVCCI